MRSNVAPKRKPPSLKFSLLSLSGDYPIVRFLIVYEFAKSTADWQLRETVSSLTKLDKNVRIHFCSGPFAEYQPGGFQPKRLVNLVVMNLLFPLLLLIIRPHWVLVRSSPPCIQLTTSFFCWLLGVRVITWLMDYHPEIEIRYLLRHWATRWLANALMRLDRFLLSKMALVIVLDSAMAECCRRRCKTVKTAVFPTWGRKVSALPAHASGEGIGSSRINLVYAGNFGAGHDLRIVGELLKGLQRRCEPHVFVVGSSQNGEESFAKLCEPLKIKYKSYPRLGFESLRSFFIEHYIHYGIVLMKDLYWGVLSPSKYSGYITFGIPIIYIGPPATNAHAVCSKFDAGIAISNDATSHDITCAIATLLDNDSLGKHRAGAARAFAYYDQFNGEAFARSLSNYIREGRWHSPHSKRLS